MTMRTETMDGQLYRRMIASGAANLRRHAAEINDLNVFPIPDGDTGDNMLLTAQGGADTPADAHLGECARRIGDSMLLSARGNSGVILSQFFDGIAAGLEGLAQADAAQLSAAFRRGVEHAYRAVVEPAEGTILTVAREAAGYAAAQNPASIDAYLNDFLYEANRSLIRTPELLSVLKKAGVVDSGGAGLIRMVEGMLHALDDDVSDAVPAEFGAATTAAKLDLSRFDENSELTFGYCTELLLRLQNAKTNVADFDIGQVTAYLQTIGDSVVAFKNGSIVKLHVHTKTPDRVLAFCQRYGEFLTVKIENMSLQHNNLETLPVPEEKPGKKPFGIVTAACGRGIQQMLRELGADVVVDGGQCMNPSAKDFLDAFAAVNAETIFVLPNNGNVLLTARQAAALYPDADVRVLESRTLGEGHAALTMFDAGSGDADAIEAALNEAMQGVITAGLSTCSRDTESDSFSLYKGEYIGFVGDHILSADNDRFGTAQRLVDGLDFTDHEICILISGEAADEKETEAIREYISASRPACELYVVDGGQKLYDYILIVE